MLYLSGQGWWPEGEKFTTACTGTLVYRTRDWDCEKVKIANASLVKRLINAKFFEKDRVSGRYYPLAVDAVHRDKRRSGSVWRICEGGGWKCITTFKEGHMPGVYEDVGPRFRCGDCEAGELLKADGGPRCRTMKWAVGVETNANKVWYYLMQIAWTLLQMFQRGFLLRLEARCRKMTQVLWCEEMRTYIRHFGCVMLVPRYRLMSRRHL